MPDLASTWQLYRSLPQLASICESGLSAPEAGGVPRAYKTKEGVGEIDANSYCSFKLGINATHIISPKPLCLNLSADFMAAELQADACPRVASAQHSLLSLQTPRAMLSVIQNFTF